MLLSLLFGLRVVFINDLHGHYENIPGIVKIFKDLKTNSSLLLNGADEFTGTSMFRYYGANKSIEIINELQYDAMTLGNHEFDKGLPYLTQYLQQLKIPIITSNVHATSNPQFNALIKPYIIKGDVGIIGSTTPDTLFQSTIKNVEFLPYIEQIQKYVNELNSKGIYKILLLSHNGYKNDQIIAKNTNGLSVIIGAHSHSLLTNNKAYAGDTIEGPFPTKVMDKTNHTVYVVQAKCYGWYVGYFDIDFYSNNTVKSFVGDSIQVSRYNVDKEWDIRVKEWNKPVEAKYGRVISKSSVDFADTCWTKHCELNKLIATTLLRFYQSKRKADHIPTFGLIQGGAARENFLMGNITVGDIFDALPFDDKVIGVVMKGDILLQCLEGSIAGYRKKLQVTGYLQGSSNTKMSIVNRKFINMHVLVHNKWELVVPTKYYRVVTSSFLLSGGDNVFPPFAKFEDGLEFVNEAVIKVFKSTDDIASLIFDFSKNKK